MIVKIFSQLIIVSTFLQLFPVDAKDLEILVNPVRASEIESISAYTPFSIPQAHLPQSQDAERVPKKVRPNSLGVITSAVSAVVVDRASGAILFQKNIDEPRSIGSITKLMTAYVFLLSNPDLNKSAEILPVDVRYGGRQHVAINEQVTVRDVFLASLVSSDNSATTALVRLSGYSEGDFVSKMNEEAARIGMSSTRFVDPTGLSSKNQSVVLDISKLLDTAANNQIIQDATQSPSVQITSQSGRTFFSESTNDLLNSFINQDPYQVEVAKTGYLPEAGYCLGSMFSKNDNQEVMVVVLGSNSDVGRFQDVKALTAWVYDTYTWPSNL